MGPEGVGVLGQTEIRNVLVRVVQNGVKMGANIRQQVVGRGKLLLQTAAHLTGGVGGGVGSLRFN